jgi:hypothetical protein
MDTPTQSFTTSEAAKRLGVSIKALRLYEQQGLVTPGRTATGYRIFGPVQMDRAASPPTRVAPYLGAPGYEAVATCLASPEVRARTARSAVPRG